MLKVTGEPSLMAARLRYTMPKTMTTIASADIIFFLKFAGSMLEAVPKTSMSGIVPRPKASIAKPPLATLPVDAAAS